MLIMELELIQSWFRVDLELTWSWFGIDLELTWSWFRIELELIWSRNPKLTQNTISAGTKGRNVTHANYQHDLTWQNMFLIPDNWDIDLFLNFWSTFARFWPPTLKHCSREVPNHLRWQKYFCCILECDRSVPSSIFSLIRYELMTLAEKLKWGGTVRFPPLLLHTV